MIWFGNLVLQVALASIVPDGLAARVKEAIARDWDRSAAVVRLRWGSIPIRSQLTDAMPFRLLGRGRDGRYVVAFGTGRGEVAVSLRAGTEDSMWVASRPLGANVRLASEDLRREVRLIWGAADQDHRRPPVGWETQRSLQAGEPLVAPAVATPPLVAPGDLVRFEWTNGTIAVVREAVAASRGRLGETIRARDQANGSSLTGVVIGPARARLSLGGTR